jgi:hypothetical protein
MSGLESGNLQTLAKFYDAQSEWLAMRWNTLVTLPFLASVQSQVIDDKTEQQLPLPGVLPEDSVRS